jgi:hypothetical protein
MLGVTVLGTLSVIVRLAEALGLIAVGLIGVTRHCPEITLASQLAVTNPA